MAGARRLSAVDQGWPLARPFAISRGVKTEARVVVCEVEDADGRAGRGECVPYARYGETVDSVIHQIAEVADVVAEGIGRRDLLDALPPGAARNAVDCALWDLECKQAGRRAWDLAGLPEPLPAVTAETIGIASPQEMAIQARRLAKAPLLKIKLDGADVRARLGAVREAAPKARLVVDPNEGWDLHRLENLAPFLIDMGVEMLEQPVPAHGDEILRGLSYPIPICADESCHTAEDLDRLVGLYDIVNVKLDKTGGLTAALDLADAACTQGFGLMVGCMVATSLAMAPATLLVGRARVVDLDGPLLLREDRVPGLDFADGRIHPPAPDLWG